MQGGCAAAWKPEVVRPVGGPPDARGLDGRRVFAPAGAGPASGYPPVTTLAGSTQYVTVTAGEVA